MDLKEASRRADPLHMDDRGDIVLGWLTKVVAVLAVLGVLGFDAISLGAARFQAEDHAQLAARAAAETYRSGEDLQAAYDAAVSEVLEHGDTIDPQTFTVAEDGTVTLTLLRVAPTMLLEKIGPAKDWARMTSTASARDTA